MKANIRSLLDRVIRDGIEHTFMNTNQEIPQVYGRLVDEIEHRIWLYIDEYFTFDE